MGNDWININNVFFLGDDLGNDGFDMGNDWDLLNFFNLLNDFNNWRFGDIDFDDDMWDDLLDWGRNGLSDDILFMDMGEVGLLSGLV